MFVDRKKVGMIGNWFCHTITANLNSWKMEQLVNTYVREECFTFDNDPFKQTYFVPVIDPATKEVVARPHKALDLHCKPGTPVYAPWDCKIGHGTKMVGPDEETHAFGATGNTLAIHKPISGFSQYLRFFMAHMQYNSYSQEVLKGIEDRSYIVPKGSFLIKTGYSGATSFAGSHKHLVFTTSLMDEKGYIRIEVGDPFISYRGAYGNIPYIYRDGEDPNGLWKWFNFDHRFWPTINVGDEKEEQYEVDIQKGVKTKVVIRCPEGRKIKELWHTGKRVVTDDAEIRVEQIMDQMLKPVLPLPDQENVGDRDYLLRGSIRYNTNVIELIYPMDTWTGIYYYQIEFENGDFSLPLRIRILED